MDLDSIRCFVADVRGVRSRIILLTERRTNRFEPCLGYLCKTRSVVTLDDSGGGGDGGDGGRAVLLFLSYLIVNTGNGGFQKDG